ncbi:penicillin acylase family protein, partial [Klebsiella pneumoniae]
FPALAAALISPRPDADGSNAWAVRVGAEGAPLVAADPHRLLELPGVYQQVRLVVEAERPRDRVDVVGLAFPGVPGVPHVGQSEH